MTSAEHQAACTRLKGTNTNGAATQSLIAPVGKGDEPQAIACKDGLGIKLLREDGVQLAIIAAQQPENIA